MKQFILFTASVLMLSACRYKSGSGILVKEERSVSSFTAVNAAGPFEVKLKQGSPAKVTVEADDNLVKYVRTEVSGHTLKISLRNGFNFHDAHFAVFVTAPEYSAVQTSAAAKVEGEDMIKTVDKLELKSSSASEIIMNVDAPSVDMDASSGAKIIAKGRSRSVLAETSSGASIEASDLLSENARAKSSSGGSVAVHASISVDASASSGGSVRYTGGASDVKKSESSGGSVTKE